MRAERAMRALLIAFPALGTSLRPARGVTRGASSRRAVPSFVEEARVAELTEPVRAARDARAGAHRPRT
jgi:hypothetical protein